MFVNIQQIKTNLTAEHQYEKQELIRLNECLCLFIDRVQQLEQQNAKYVAILADARRKSSNISVFGTEWDERHIHQQADLMTVSCTNIGYENHFELFQMQSEIYKQLIHIVSQSSNEQRLKLQQELDHSSSTLINVRTSYEDLQKTIEVLHVEREDIFQQYLKVANTWGHWKKQISELKVSVNVLKNQHVFYKDIRSYATSDSFSMEVFDVKQFWALKMDKIIANIRHDYELLYASIHREAVVYYEKKMEEVQVEVKQAKVEQTNYHQQVEVKQWEMIQQTLQIEYEEAQKMYAYEKETQTKLEVMHSKLESEYASIHLQLSERFEEHSKSLHISQEKVIMMVDSIEEMRRTNIHLESELIIYRRLLELDEVHKTVAMKTFVVERQERASIGIECPTDSTYISLMNHSANKDIDISRWMLTRRIDSKTELKYTLPDQTRLPAGGELRIYSKLGADAAQLSSNYDDVSHHLHGKVVSNTISSWVIGDKIETRLFNEYGEEKASYIQTATSEARISN